MKMSRTILIVAVFAIVLAATANTLFAQQSGQQQQQQQQKQVQQQKQMQQQMQQQMTQQGQQTMNQHMTRTQQMVEWMNRLRERANKLGEQITQRTERDQNQTRTRDQERLMQHMSASVGSMTDEMKTSMEQLQKMMQNKNMVADKQMEQEMLKLNENFQNMGENVENTLTIMERINTRLEQMESTK